MTNINNLLKGKHNYRSFIRKQLNSFSPKQLKQVKYENKRLTEIFKEIVGKNKSYSQIKEIINEKWYKQYYDSLEHDYLKYETIDVCVEKEYYSESRYSEKIRQIYENTICRKIIHDIRKTDLNYRAYHRILELNLFDKEYYTAKYNYDLSVDPLLHYIYIGYREDKNPSKEFDGNYYENFNKNVKKSNLNPLVYLVLYGIGEGLVQINKNAWQPLSINRFKINDKIKTFHKNGITETKRNPQLIISITSYLKRIDDVKYSLYSLLNQELKPDKVILWLCQDEFPNKEEDLPESILNFRENGLTIEWSSNMKSYKKIIPSLKEYSNDIIVTADDDIYYPENWLKILYEEHKKHPRDIIAHRCKKISYNKEGKLQPYKKWEIIKQEEKPSYQNFFTTGAGVLFPPHSLNTTVLNYKTAKKLCPYADDIWIWAMALLNNTKTRIPENPIHRLTYVNLSRDVFNNKDTLWYYNQKYNDIQIKNILEKYPTINLKLLK